MSTTKIPIPHQVRGRFLIQRDCEMEDYGAVGGAVEPYHFEPVKPEDYEEPEEDEDGLTPATLASRSENRIAINTW